MRYPAAQTAERHEGILDAAARLFRERGFEGVKVADVMAAAGLTHGAFYAHFPSKAALAAASVERGLDEMLRHLDRALAADDPGRAFADGYLSAQHRDHPGQGCVIAALGPEFARAAESERSGFSERIRTLIARMASGFSWRRRADARAEAIRMVATLVGAIVLARAVNDPALSDEIIAAARARFGLGTGDGA